MENTDIEGYLQLLQSELERLDAQIIGLRKIQERRDLVFNLVTQTRYLLGKGPYTSPITNPKQEVIQVNDSKQHGVLDDATYEVMTGGISSTEELNKLRATMSRKSIWECTRDILKQAGHPLTLGEIVAALRGFSFNIAGRAGKESVRAILHKKPNIFGRTEDGKFTLREG